MKNVSSKCEVKVIVKDNKFIPGLGPGPIVKPKWVSVERFKELQTLGFNVIAVGSLDTAYEDIIKDLDSDLRPKSPNEKIVEQAITMIKDFEQPEEVTVESVQASLEVLLEEVNFDELIVRKNTSAVNTFDVKVVSGKHSDTKTIKVTHVISATPIEPGDTSEYDQKLIEQEFVKLQSLQIDEEEITAEMVQELVESIVEDVKVDVVETDKEKRMFEITLTRNEQSVSKVIKVVMPEPETPEEPEDTSKEDEEIIASQLELIEDYKTREEVTIDNIREYLQGKVEGVGVVVKPSGDSLGNANYFQVTLTRNQSSASKTIRVIHVVDMTPIEPGDTTKYDTQVVLDQLAKVEDYETREEVNVETVTAKIEAIVNDEVEVTVEDLNVNVFKVTLTRNEVSKFKEIKVTHIIDMTPIEPGDTSLYDEKLVDAELTKVVPYETDENPTVESVTEHLSEIINEEVGEFIVTQVEGVNTFEVTLTRNTITKSKQFKVTHVIPATPIEPGDTSAYDLEVVLAELEKVESFKTREEVTVELVEEHVRESIDLDKVAIESIEEVEGQLNKFKVTLTRKDQSEHKVIKVTYVIDMTPIEPGDTTEFDQSQVDEAIMRLTDLDLGEIDADDSVLELVKVEVKELLEGLKVAHMVDQTNIADEFKVTVALNDARDSKVIKAKFTVDLDHGVEIPVDDTEVKVQDAMTEISYIHTLINDKELDTAQEALDRLVTSLKEDNLYDHLADMVEPLAESLEEALNEKAEQEQKEKEEKEKQEKEERKNELFKEVVKAMEAVESVEVANIEEPIASKLNGAVYSELAKHLVESEEFEVSLVVGEISEVEDNQRVANYMVSVEELDQELVVIVVGPEVEEPEEEEVPEVEEPEVPEEGEKQPEEEDKEQEAPEVEEKEEEDKGQEVPEVEEPEVPEEEEGEKEPEVDEKSPLELKKEELIEAGYEYDEEENLFMKDDKYFEIDPESLEIFEVVFEEEEEK